MLHPLPFLTNYRPRKRNNSNSHSRMCIWQASTTMLTYWRTFIGAPTSAPACLTWTISWLSWKSWTLTLAFQKFSHAFLQPTSWSWAHYWRIAPRNHSSKTLISRWKHRKSRIISSRSRFIEAPKKWKGQQARPRKEGGKSCRNLLNRWRGRYRST